MKARTCLLMHPKSLCTTPSVTFPAKVFDFFTISVSFWGASPLLLRRLITIFQCFMMERNGGSFCEFGFSQKALSPLRGTTLEHPKRSGSYLNELIIRINICASD
jgi:hypothetical protein